ncbi:hypothetical protein [Comamonas testosteroni]|uniref:hypothetical protein n=1 Tax=Comamonas testosteroni TaxID=285 RepID=UPI0026F10E19|nr:hypothetical protein [Comamonas testosteroni]
MARRYGRNQRRRAREALASEQAAHASTATYLKSERECTWELRSQLEEVAEILGTNFIGLQAKLRTIPIQDDQDSFLCGLSDGNMQTMQILRVDSSEDWHRNATHLHAKLSGVKVVYALSETAISRTPAKSLAHRIAKEIAGALLYELHRRGIR